ncbi:MAG: toprim domain-containing protein, partial [Chloroflexota bacterium]|nr:toprim domain-containing protein [Chloroflexota bacterium]
AGLLAEKEGRFFDLFRGRLMFPIRDSHGKAIGFGARALDDATPKYINSPQTPIFEKSGTLYGLDRARTSLREKGMAVIVEGYMDVIMAHQYGFTNVVGTMGTALSPKHIASLKGLAQGLVLALDPDRAGDQATLRGIEVARQALEREAVAVPDWLGADSRLKARVAVLSLPRGRDPDEVIRESPESWGKLMKEALLLPDYLIKVTTEGRDLSSPSDRSAIAQRLLPFIVEMADEVQRALYLGKLAHLLEVPERDLGALAARLRRTSGERKAPVRLLSLPDAPHRDPIERYALCLLLQHPELREKCLALQGDDFIHPENRALWETWKDWGAGGCREKVDEELREYMDSLLGQSLPPTTDATREQALSDCIRRLKERRLKRLKEEEGWLLSEGEASGGAQDLASLAYNLWRGLGEAEGQDQASARLARLQQQGIELNTELLKIFTEGEHRNKPSRGD